MMMTLLTRMPRRDLRPGGYPSLIALQDDILYLYLCHAMFYVAILI